MSWPSTVWSSDIFRFAAEQIMSETVACQRLVLETVTSFPTISSLRHRPFRANMHLLPRESTMTQVSSFIANLLFMELQ